MKIIHEKFCLLTPSAPQDPNNSYTAFLEPHTPVTEITRNTDMFSQSPHIYYYMQNQNAFKVKWKKGHFLCTPVSNILCFSSFSVRFSSNFQSLNNLNLTQAEHCIKKKKKKIIVKTNLVETLAMQWLHENSESHCQQSFFCHLVSVTSKEISEDGSVNME